MCVYLTYQRAIATAGDIAENSVEHAALASVYLLFERLVVVKSQEGEELAQVSGHDDVAALDVASLRVRGNTSFRNCKEENNY